MPPIETAGNNGQNDREITLLHPSPPLQCFKKPYQDMSKSGLQVLQGRIELISNQCTMHNYSTL